MSTFTAVAWASDSDYSAAWPVSGLFDGKVVGDSPYRWNSGQTAMPHWARGDYGSAVTATWYTIAAGYDTGADPKNFTFEGSNDTTSWTVLDTQTGQTFPNVRAKTYSFANSTAYRYYRLFVTLSNGVNYTGAAELIVGDGIPPSRILDWAAPPNSSGGDFTLGVEFYPMADGQATHLSYYEMSNMTGAVTLKLTNAAGTVIATVTDTAVNGRFGWRDVAITPVALTANSHYETSYYANSTFAYFSWWTGNAGALQCGDLVLVPNGSGTVRGQTANPRYASGNNVTNTFGGNVYGTSLVFQRTGDYGNTAMVANVYAEALVVPAAPTAQVEAVYAEALVLPAAPTSQIEAVYAEVLYLPAPPGPPRTDISQFPFVSHIRAEDHALGPATTLTDRAGSSWVGHSGATLAGGQPVTPATVVASGTPSRTKSITFNGDNPYGKLHDVGMMYVNDVEAVFASQVFNGRIGDYSPANILGASGQWATSDATVPAWWAVKLKAAYPAASYSVAHSGDTSRTMKDWKFQGSNNSTNGADGTWVDLDTHTNQGGITALSTYSFANTTPYRWYRIYATALNGGGLWYLTQVNIEGVALLGYSVPAAEHWLVVRSTLDGTGHPTYFANVGDTRYTLSGQIYTGWGTSGRINYTPTLAALNNWRIYRIVRDPLTGTTKEYLDGVLQSSQGSGAFMRGPLIGSGVSMRFTGNIAASMILHENLSNADAIWLDAYLRTTYLTAPPPPVYIGWGVPRIDPDIVVDTNVPTQPGDLPYLADSVLWLASASLSGANGTVPGTWPDSSPATRTVTHTTAGSSATIVAAATPKGTKAVAFPGGSSAGHFLVSASALPTNRDGELWMVLKSNDTGGNGSSKWGGDASQQNHYAYGGTVYDDTGCTSRQSQTPGAITSWHVYRVQTIGTSRNVWVNGTLVWGPGTVTPFWRQAPILGGNNTGSASYFFNGSIAEVIQFNRALTAGQATEVLGYLTATHL